MPGFNFLAISFDWMHNVYLGTGRDLCASGIMVLIEKGLVGDVEGVEMDEALSRVHRRMRDVCRQHGFPECANVPSVLVIVGNCHTFFVFLSSQP